jgi:hypothetical protein
MQRAPPNINLYDRPLYARRRYAPRSESLSVGTVLLSCTVITLATVVFFWSYDAIAHRDGLYLPSSARVAVGDRRSVPANETEALVPDMTAPEVVRANADVPRSAAQKNDAKKDTAHAAVEPHAAAPPRKKTVRRISPEARDSYASAPAFSGSARMDGW